MIQRFFIFRYVVGLMLKLLPIFVLLFPLLFMACDEELPPVNNPQDLFSGTATVQYRYDPTVRPTTSSIDIYIVIKNYYDETLDDFAALNGSIRIEWLAPSEERGSIVPVRTDQLTTGNLFAAKGYNYLNNRLSIDPGDSIVLRYRWNLKTDDSTSLIKQVKYTYDRDCLVSVCGGDAGYRGISGRQPFRVNANITVFQRSGTVAMKTKEFSVCWIQPHCGELSACNLPNPENPCNVVP